MVVIARTSGTKRSQQNETAAVACFAPRDCHVALGTLDAPRNDAVSIPPESGFPQHSVVQKDFLL